MSKLYVDLNKLSFNVKNIKSLLNNNTKIIAMVKANAYGCGDIEIVKALINENISDFGVALVDEGVKIKQLFSNVNVLVTSQFLEEEIPDIIKYNLIVSVSSIEVCNKLNEYAKKENKSVDIHIKIDTGMTRLGFNYNEALEKILYIKTNFKYLNIKGVYTHLSCSDSDLEYTKKQLSRFDAVIKNLKKSDINPEYIHALNSAGTMCFKDYNYTHVRCGIALYGYYPDNNFKNKVELQPILKLTAPIINIRTLNDNVGISYNKTHFGKPGDKIATIQIGYADGLKRSLSNQYKVTINGHKCRIVGNICMDMCMIDITGIDNINIGDEVIIFEKQDDIDEIAAIENTINYEIISTISNRVKRIYKN